MTQHELKPHTVIYEERSLSNSPTIVVSWQFFECQAEDDEHAEEQCRNAYPDATILWVNTGHGGSARTMESMSL